MAWTLGGVRIFPEKITQSEKPILAELQPVEGGTIIHVFGYEDELMRIEGKLVGPTDRLTLRDLIRTGSPITLSGPNGVIDEYTVKSSEFDRLNVICQTLRPDLADDEIVYQMSLEMRRDE